MANADERFELAVEPHIPALRAYCAGLAACRWDAEDLFQETLLKMLRYSRKTGTAEVSRPLLFKSAKNIWIDRYRRLKGRPPAAPLEEASGIEPPVDYVTVRALLEWMSESLSERRMRILLLAEVFGYTYAEIAGALGLRMPQVRMELHYARQTLKARKLASEESSPASKGPGRTRTGARRQASKARIVDSLTAALTDHNFSLLLRACP